MFNAADINRLIDWHRRELGQRIHFTFEEMERLKIYNIARYDKTEEEVAEFFRERRNQKARDKARERRRIEREKRMERETDPLADRSEALCALIKLDEEASVAQLMVRTEKPASRPIHARAAAPSEGPSSSSRKSAPSRSSTSPPPAAESPRFWSSSEQRTMGKRTNRVSTLGDPAKTWVSGAPPRQKGIVHSPKSLQAHAPGESARGTSDEELVETPSCQRKERASCPPHWSASLPG
jgi:hypothetical protein